MKVIELKTVGDHSTFVIVQNICSGSPQGMNLTQMRSRIRILDALEAAKDAKDFRIEDADYSTLVEALNSTQWAIAHRDLLVVVDGILNAPDATKLKAVEK